MMQDWGKIVAGNMFIEDELLVKEGKLISIDEIDDKNEHNIKQINYEPFPGIEPGYWYSNYWEGGEDGIAQKWKKHQIPRDPATSLKVTYERTDEAIDQINEMAQILKSHNGEELNNFFAKNPIMDKIYVAASDYFKTTNVFDAFFKKNITIKQLFQGIDLDRYLLKECQYVEDGDYYIGKDGSVIMTYQYIKHSFYIISSLLNFTTLKNMTYLKMSYIYAYTLLDNFVLQSIETIAQIDSRTTIKYVNSIQSIDAINAEEHHDLIKIIIQKLIEQMGWKSFEEKIEYFDNAGVKIDDKDSPSIKNQIILIGEKRNVIVHNQGIVNDSFINKIRHTEFTEKYKVGDIINLDIEMLLQDTAIIRDYLKRVYKAIADKYALIIFD